jgi:hypothetical protein
MAVPSAINKNFTINDTRYNYFAATDSHGSSCSCCFVAGRFCSFDEFSKACVTELGNAAYLLIDLFDVELSLRVGRHGSLTPPGHIAFSVNGIAFSINVNDVSPRWEVMTIDGKAVSHSEFRTSVMNVCRAMSRLISGELRLLAYQATRLPKVS